MNNKISTGGNNMINSFSAITILLVVIVVAMFVAATETSEVAIMVTLGVIVLAVSLKAKKLFVEFQNLKVELTRAFRYLEENLLNTNQNLDRIMFMLSNTLGNSKAELFNVHENLKKKLVRMFGHFKPELSNVLEHRIGVLSNEYRWRNRNWFSRSSSGIWNRNSKVGICALQ